LGRLSALESSEVVEWSPPQTPRTERAVPHFLNSVFAREGAVADGSSAPVLVFDEQLGVSGRLPVARQNQSPLIDGTNPNVDHFDFRQLSEYRRGCQRRGVTSNAIA